MQGSGVSHVETAAKIKFEFGVDVQTSNGVAWAVNNLLQDSDGYIKYWRV